MCFSGRSRSTQSKEASFEVASFEVASFEVREKKAGNSRPLVGIGNATSLLPIDTCENVRKVRLHVNAQ